MLTRAIPTSVVWIIVVLALDPPPVMAATGVGVALLLGWREERTPRAADGTASRSRGRRIFYV